MKSPDKTKTILQQALKLDGEARTVLLETINDDAVKSQVQTLLADEAQLKQFLKQENGLKPTSNKQQSIRPGTLIKRIRIIKLLGQGGMGSVYLGFDEKLERQVAVKSIRSEHLKNPATQQRFVREAQIMSKINHPSICQLYDYMETPEGDFLVLEYIKGKPLYQVPMTTGQKLEYMADLAAALDVAHQQGVIHRDLKPDNIMITESGHLKVLDFGIAQSMTSTNDLTNKPNHPTTANNTELTQQGSLVGTIRYMSPEQASGRELETSSDLYALGIIVQEVFSHQAAYNITHTEQLLVDVQQGRRSAMVDAPDAVIQLVEQLTQVNPASRPTAAAATKRIQAIINAPKHKKLKIIKYGVTSFGLLLLVLLVWQWQQSYQQTINHSTVKQYEDQINDLVKQAEQIYVLPIHPVNDEISAVLQKGDELFNVISADEKLTDVAKKRLQGIILNKGEYHESAIPLLVAGEAESQLLADAWTKLYIEKATDYSEQYGYEQTMKDQSLKENYLKPALKYIKQAAQESGKTNALLHAFMVSQTESFEAGLDAVNQLLAQEGWNKDAVNLKALMLYALMAQAREQGQWQQAKDHALMTADTYQRSIQMARSYPPAYNSLCLTTLGLMSDGVQRSGEQVNHFFEQSIAACENALKLQPANKYPMHLLTRAYLLKALWQTDHGIDASDTLNQAKHWNQKASSLQDLFSSSWSQALILTAEAKGQLLQGQQADATINSALDVYAHLLKLETEYQPFVVSDVLFALSIQAHDSLRRNQDPAGVVARAEALFNQVSVTDELMVSEQWALVNNLAQIYFAQLLYNFENHQNIIPLANKLLGFLNPDDNMIENDPLQFITLANTHLLMAEYLRSQQQAVNEHLQQVENYLAQAHDINPNNHSARLSSAVLLTLQGAINPQNYRQANQAFTQAMAINPNNPYSLNTWAKSLLIQASNSPSQQQQTAISLADQKIKQALSIDKNNQLFIKTQNQILELAESISAESSP